MPLLPNTRRQPPSSILERHITYSKLRDDPLAARKNSLHPFCLSAPKYDISWKETKLVTQLDIMAPPSGSSTTGNGHNTIIHSTCSPHQYFRRFIWLLLWPHQTGFLLARTRSQYVNSHLCLQCRPQGNSPTQAAHTLTRAINYSHPLSYNSRGRLCQDEYRGPISRRQMRCHSLVLNRPLNSSPGREEWTMIRGKKSFCWLLDGDVYTYSHAL